MSARKSAQFNAKSIDSTYRHDGRSFIASSPNDMCAVGNYMTCLLLLDDAFWHDAPRFCAFPPHSDRPPVPKANLSLFIISHDPRWQSCHNGLLVLSYWNSLPMSDQPLALRQLVKGVAGVRDLSGVYVQTGGLQRQPWLACVGTTSCRIQIVPRADPSSNQHLGRADSHQAMHRSLSLPLSYGSEETSALGRHLRLDVR